MKDLIEFVAKKLVDNPDEVRVDEVPGDESTTYELRVAQTDMGRIIGRSGRTAKALRTLVGSASAKANTYCNLEIMDEEGGRAFRGHDDAEGEGEGDAEGEGHEEIHAEAEAADGEGDGA